MTPLERRIEALRFQLAATCLVLGVSAPAVGIAQVALYGVGDLPGGIVQSEVRDATRAGSVLYAVGGSSATPVAGTVGNDTAFLWTSANPPLVAGLTETSGSSWRASLGAGYLTR